MSDNINREYETLIIKDTELSEAIACNVLDYWKYLNCPKRHLSESEAIEVFLDNERSKAVFLDKLESETFKFAGKAVLDVGCGKGGVCILCAQRGAEVVGFDTDEDEIGIAESRVESLGLGNVYICKGDAEKIPYSDNYFDIVTATSVLEHVKDLDAVIKEISRVVKPGGYCSITVPNPLFFREGHYKVFCIPHLPKGLCAFYLKLRGFNPDFLVKHVTYPYPAVHKIKESFHANGMEARNVAEEDIMSKLSRPETIRNGRAKKAAVLIKKLKLTKLASKLVASLLQPGVHIIAKKKQDG